MVPTAVAVNGFPTDLIAVAVDGVIAIRLWNQPLVSDAVDPAAVASIVLNRDV